MTDEIEDSSAGHVVPEPMEFHPDTDRPDTFIIDGVQFSGNMLRAMTQPDPTRLLSFQREGYDVKVFDKTQMRKDNERTIDELREGLKKAADELIDERNKTRRLEKEAEVTKMQFECAASKLDEAVAERDQFKRRYQGMHDNLEKAIKKIKILNDQLDGPQNDTAPAGG